MATDYLFEAGPYGEDELTVLRFTGSERLSQPFWYDVTLVGKGLTVDFEEMIGAEACLRLATPEGERFVHGVIARWEESGSGRNWTTYEASVVPRLWALRLRRDSRIFQNQTTPDIVKDVLAGAGVPSDEFRFALQGSYKPRTYCVQYRETDLDFMSRLLEEEGMFYFFEQTEDGHVLVIGDTNDACVPLDGNDLLTFREGDPGLQGREQVTRLRYARQLRTGSVSLLDFDFKKPSLDQTVTEADSEAKKESKFIAEDFPGEYPDPGLGTRLAKVRLEEQRAETCLGVGETDCRRLAPGWRFTLEQHLNDELNQEYLVVAARHRGVQPQGGHGGGGEGDVTIYRCHFECIPSRVAYRAPRVTPRPRLDGLQTAMVVGPAGEEIHCDDYGRVKVKFPWDRSGATDDKASCWMRSSQQWGGGGWGSMYIPRVGQEVVVEFLEGDPDRPLITGRLYNGASPVPYELPHQKIVTTMQSSSSPGGKGANELRLNDTSGGEELFTNASKDMNSKVENDRNLDVHSNEVVSVGGNVGRTVDGNEKVTIGKHRTEQVGGDQKRIIKIDEKWNVTGSLSRETGGVRLGLVKGDSKLNVSGDNGRTVGAILIEMVKGDSKREADGMARMNSGAVTVELVKGEHKEETEARHAVLVGALVLKKTKADYTRESKGMVVFTCPILKINAETIEIEGDGDIGLAVGASALIVKSGAVSILSDAITIKASGSLVGKGSMIPWN